MPCRQDYNFSATESQHYGINIKRHKIPFEDSESNSGISTKRLCSITETGIDCPLAEFGCSRNIPNEDFDQHLLSREHQLKVCQILKENISQIDKLKTTEDLPVNEEIFIQYNALIKSTGFLADALCSLKDDHVQLAKNVQQIEYSIREDQLCLDRLKESVDESAQILSVVQLSQNILSNEIFSIKESIRKDPSSLDGSYIWKITNVAQRLRDAKNEIQPSFYSEPFYSAANGYKMCLRIYLNGDGCAHSTHVSLFFVLMRGDYDPILAWPFDYKVIFCIFDQSGKKNHLVDSFRPNLNSNSFQQPKSLMNIASGIPRFAPISLVFADQSPYIVDNTIFVKCIIDFSAIPKSLISSVMSLNPALPIDVQKQMIQLKIDENNKNKGDVRN